MKAIASIRNFLFYFFVTFVSMPIINAQPVNMPTGRGGRGMGFGGRWYHQSMTRWMGMGFFMKALSIVVLVLVIIALVLIIKKMLKNNKK